MLLERVDGFLDAAVEVADLRRILRVAGLCRACQLPVQRGKCRPLKKVAVLGICGFTWLALDPLHPVGKSAVCSHNLSAHGVDLAVRCAIAIHESSLRALKCLQITLEVVNGTSDFTALVQDGVRVALLRLSSVTIRLSITKGVLLLIVLQVLHFDRLALPGLVWWN